MDLAQKQCVPCAGGASALGARQIKDFVCQLKTPWEVVEQKKIRKNFSFKNYQQTMQFVNKVADLAEAEGHHPEMHVGWGKVVVEIWTHTIGGLSENDFILAAKIDEL